MRATEKGDREISLAFLCRKKIKATVIFSHKAINGIVDISGHNMWMWSVLTS